MLNICFCCKKEKECITVDERYVCANCNNVQAEEEKDETE